MSLPNRMHSLHHMPTAEAVRANARRRVYQSWTAAILLAALATVLFVGLTFDNILLPLAAIVALVLPVLFWRYSKLATYLIFAGVCLFELFPTNFPDALTDRVPLFWNINTIVQRLGHATNFHGIPLNLFEILLLVSGTIALFRGVFSRTSSLRVGPTFWPIFIYILFVGFAEIHGVGTGGDFKISLEEVRSQFYFLIAYLIAVNTIREPKQLSTVQWIMAICIGIKGILYTFRRYVTLAGLPLPDQGVGSHEEAFFFDTFLVLLFILVLFGVQPKLRRTMWVLLIPVLLGELACNRRTGTAAVLIIIPVIFLAVYQALPNRRKLARNLGLGLLIGFSIYYPIFKDSTGAIGQPARAIKSQLDPDKRDKNSDAYRLAEEADLYATIKTSPVIGYGYGKRMLHAVPIADISKTYPMWDIMTHNQILWVWMRVGTLGFVAFWCMVAAIVFQACAMLRNIDNASIKATALFVICITGMLMIFGLLDLQLSDFRDMLFVGFWAGISGSLPAIARGAANTGSAGTTDGHEPGVPAGRRAA